MRESLKSRLVRWRVNLFPAYRRTGARLTYIAADFHEVRVKLPLNRRTRNCVGTMFGGTMYAAVDPVYVMMLVHLLGPGYVVWDRSASIRFRKPGRSTLFATFCLDPDEVDSIRRELAQNRSLDRAFRIDLTDADGSVHATIEQKIYVRRKDTRGSKVLIAKRRGRGAAMPQRIAS